MMCYCKFKTCWTLAQISEKLKLFGYTTARKLGSGFTTKDTTFSALAV